MTLIDNTASPDGVPLADKPVQNPVGGINPQRQPNLPTPGIAPRSVNLQSVLMPAVMLLIAAYFAVVSPNHVFISPRNLSMLAIELSVTACLALGMLLVILPGHIDLACGSGVGLIGGIAAVLIINHGWSAPLSMLSATIGAVIVWWLMGWIIVSQRVPAFIITLGGMLGFRGLHWMIIQDGTVPVAPGGTQNIFSELTTVYIPPVPSLIVTLVCIAALFGATFAGHQRLKAAGAKTDGEATFLRTFLLAQVMLLFVLVCNAYRGVPLPAVILGIVTLLVSLLTKHTPFGRYLYAIGGNEEAAVVSGIPVAKVTIGAFVIMGLLTALTGFLQTAYAGASTTTVGRDMELDAVAACVIGGISLKGGRGTVAGALLGALVIAMLLNGMTLMAYSPEAKYVIRGLVLAAAVWIDVRFGKQ